MKLTKLVALGLLFCSAYMFGFAISFICALMFLDIDEITGKCTDILSDFSKNHRSLQVHVFH